MAGKPRAADTTRSKPVGHAVQRLRLSRRARLQCCAAFTVFAAAMWLSKWLWAQRLADLMAAEQVRHVAMRHSVSSVVLTCLTRAQLPSCLLAPRLGRCASSAETPCKFAALRFN